MWDEPLDRTIDETARQMTAGAPSGSAEFRRSVLARIESGAAPRTVWHAAWVLAPIAASAVIGLGVFVARPAPYDVARVKPDAGEAAAGPKGPALPLEQVGAELAPPSTGRRPGPFGPHVLIQPRGDFERAPADLESLAVMPLALEALVSDAIQIETLDPIVPITVAPLEIGDTQRRNE